MRTELCNLHVKRLSYSIMKMKEAGGYMYNIFVVNEIINVNIVSSLTYNRYELELLTIKSK